MSWSSTASHGLKDFVDCYKTTISPGGCANKVVNLYLGNEAADADSSFSALCYAYHSWLKAKVSTSSSASSSSSGHNEVFVPLSFVQSLDLPLRAELKIILNKVGLDSKDLLLVDQFISAEGVSKSKLGDAEKVRITLLDHNSLSKQFVSSLTQWVNPQKVEVVEIFDHHCDEQDHSHVEGGRRRIAFESEPSMRALVGSCCTLIHEAIAQDAKDLSFLSQSNKDIAWPLLGVILLDTLNMDPTANRGTERDQQALDALRSVLGLDHTQVKAFFDELSNAKTDPQLWESLTVAEALRFDYKKFTAVGKSTGTTISIGFSSVLLPIDRFCIKELFQTQISLFMEKCQVNYLVIMTFYQENDTNKPIRELMIVERGFTPVLSSYLRDVESLQLSPLSLSSAPDFSSVDCVMNSFNQGNVKASRKQVAPIVVEYFEQ